MMIKELINRRCGDGFVWQMAIVALSAAAFFALVVPFQTFMGNQTMFSYGCARLLAECVPYAMLLFVSLWVILIAAGALLWRIPSVLLVALLLCLYLETGVLSNALPPINGDLCILENAYQKVLDSAIWAGIFGLCAVLYKWLKTYAHWTALAILIMGIASLFDVRVDEKHSHACALQSGLCEKYQVIKSVKYSPGRNVLVFILDSLPATVAADVIGGDKSLKEKFNGFVAYRNNIAMHEGTVRGLPGLMTGHYFGKNDTSHANTMSIFGKDSFLYMGFENDTPTFFSGALFEYGYTNRRKVIEVAGAEPKVEPWSVFMRRTNETPYLNLYEIVLFRVAPFVKKFSILNLAIQRSRIAPSVKDERFVYDILANANVSTNAATMLGVFHTHGTHSPLRDRDGKRWQGVESVEGVHEAARFVLGELGRLFDVLRDRGIYDKSFIVVTSDHGSPIMSANPEEMGAASGALVVKPIGDRAEFGISTIPTSHCRISSMVAKAYGDDIDQKAVSGLLYCQKRRFVGRPHKTMHFYEWIYDENGKVSEKNDLGVFTCK